jgi:hypothetical protein
MLTCCESGLKSRDPILPGTACFNLQQPHQPVAQQKESDDEAPKNIKQLAKTVKQLWTVPFSFLLAALCAVGGCFASWTGLSTGCVAIFCKPP